MNVLFLMINFQDIKKDPYLYTDISEEFYKRGNNVYVATILEKKYSSETIYNNEYGLNVLRIKTGDMFNVGLIKKGLTTISIPFVFRKAINKYFKNIKFDLVIYPTPPITFASVVKYIKKRDKCNSYLVLRDIFPQNGVDLDIIKNKLIYYLFRKKEKQLYKVSDYIGCMSQGNIDYILKHNNLPPYKIEILYNWTQNKNECVKINKNYIEKYGLVDKFIAIHGGNIGIAQELEFLLELAKEFKYRSDIVFLIIGRGTERNKIENIVKREKLENVIMDEYVQSLEFDELVKECNIGLVNLSKKFTIPNFPSKTLTYFKAGIPILAAIDKSTDYGEFLEYTNSGLWSYTGDLAAYKNNFEKLLNNKALREEMGKSGQNFLKENLYASKAYEIIIKHFINGVDAIVQQ